MSSSRPFLHQVMDELIKAFSLMFTPGSELSQIILLTLQMAAFSTVISTVIGVPLGVLVGLYRFPGKRLVMRRLNTLMGLPPVLAGLVVFFILSPLLFPVWHRAFTKPRTAWAFRAFVSSHAFYTNAAHNSSPSSSSHSADPSARWAPSCSWAATSSTRRAS